MSVSENFIPQSENLDKLIEVLSDLDDQSKRNTERKNSILSKIDSLTTLINKDAHQDYSAVIAELNRFLEKYSTDDVEGVKGASKGDWNGSQKEQLQSQNKRLKEILRTKHTYNEEAMTLSLEYEDAIRTVTQALRTIKYKRDLETISTFTEVSSRIQALKVYESQVFQDIIDTQDNIYVLVQRLRDVYGFIIKHNSENEIHINKLLHEAEFYQRLSN